MELIEDFAKSLSNNYKTDTKIEQLFDMLVEKLEDGASDIYFQEELKPVVRIKNGDLIYLDYDILTKEHIQHILSLILNEAVYGKEYSIIKSGKQEVDLIVTIRGRRFRANITSFYSNERTAIFLRYIKEDTPDLTTLGIPNTDLLLDRIKNISGGLILVCGPTGSGKSTTLASIIEYINQNHNRHIVTLEDPIEYIFKSKKSIITQKQVFTDTESFSRGLREALREDPDIIVVGEMRDVETIITALQASETGHTVFATLHTSSTAQTIERIVNAFPENKQQEIRISLALALRVIIIQRLIPTTKNTRTLACEIAFNNKMLESNISRNQINQIENTIYMSRQQGMLLLNQHLMQLIQDGTITPRIALAYSYKPDELKNEIKQTYGDIEL
jgi:twitching motility protein PilT